MKNQTITINGKKVYQSSIRRISNLGDAEYKANELSFNKHNLGKSGYSVLHGDDGKFWVTTNRNAKLLSQAGYEIVHRAGGFAGMRILQSRNKFYNFNS